MRSASVLPATRESSVHAGSWPSKWRDPDSNRGPRFSVPWWDTLVHGALPAVLAPTGLIVLIRVGVLPDVLEPGGDRAAFGTVLLVFLVAAGFGTVYEVYEWFSDSSLGTHYQPDASDAMTDITANAVGGLAGGVWLAAWAARAGRR